MPIFIEIWGLEASSVHTENDHQSTLHNDSSSTGLFPVYFPFVSSSLRNPHAISPVSFQSNIPNYFSKETITSTWLHFYQSSVYLEPKEKSFVQLALFILPWLFLMYALRLDRSPAFSLVSTQPKIMSPSRFTSPHV